MNLTEKKSKTINIRVTESENSILKEKADSQNLHVSTYILNQCLAETSMIYGEEFYNLILNLSSLAATLQDNKICPEEISRLTTEVQKIWQFLK